MSGMEWIIQECSYGGVMASYGIPHAGGVEVGYKPGVTMPCFIDCFSCHFDTRKQAERYIEKHPNPLK